jgi:hypothetical protein
MSTDAAITVERIDDGAIAVMTINGTLPKRVGITDVNRHASRAGRSEWRLAKDS